MTNNSKRPDTIIDFIMMRLSIPRRASFIGLIGFCVIFVIYTDFEASPPYHRNLSNEEGMDENNNQQYYQDRNNLPVMHTFFEPVEGGCCGMTEQGHSKLLKAWEEAWQTYGWDTKILTEADARRHPDFDLFEEKMASAQVNNYNRRCFWRWLAMAMLEDGGWMSDYDNFPLTLTGNEGRELMQQPGFKSWALHVPALIHGDHHSLVHIAELMRDHISPDLDVDYITDMYVLLYLKNNLTASGIGATVWKREVYPGFPYFNSTDGPKINCDVAKRFLSAHLSHFDSEHAFEVLHTYPYIEGMTSGQHSERRGEAAAIMMKDFQQHCIN